MVFQSFLGGTINVDVKIEDRPSVAHQYCFVKLFMHLLTFKALLSRETMGGLFYKNILEPRLLFDEMQFAPFFF